MAAKIALLIAAGLALTPAVATLGAGQDHRASANRLVELHGPIFGFTQTQDRIQVRLAPARNDPEGAERTRIVVRTADGDSETMIALPIRKGQTWLSANLPSSLAQAETLIVTVD